VSGSPMLFPTTSSLQNSQCTINGSGLSLSSSGTSLSLTVPLTFNDPLFAGDQVLYLAARDSEYGYNSGWQETGYWTIPPPTVTMPPPGTVGSSYSYTMQVIGGVGSLTWSLGQGALPPGLTLQTSGLLSGTPISAGTYTFEVHIANSVGDTQTVTVSLTTASSVRTSLEINLAALPVDLYDDTQTENPYQNGTYYPTCPSNVSVRECIRRFFNNNPANSPTGLVVANNYVSQGVTGVRFFFALGGGSSSTPFPVGQTVGATWIHNLKMFFQDLRQWGIQDIAPNLAIDARWGGMLTVQSVPDTCVAGNPSVTLAFLPWLPYGLDPNSYAPYNNGMPNQQYNCGPTNPSFWGWSPLLAEGTGLIDQILGAAQSTGLFVREFEMQNENQIGAFTIQAQMIYDNTTSTNVMQQVSQLMNNHNFPSAATVSVVVSRPSEGSSSIDCPSVYGDSAHIMGSSQLLAAFGGAKIGSPPFVAYNGEMPCDNSTLLSNCGPQSGPGWAACATNGMISIPSSPVPSVQDVHSKPCLTLGSGACDLSGSTQANATNVAQNIYNGIATFFSVRNLTSSVLADGETSANQPNASCDGGTSNAVTSQQNGAGYFMSSLFTNNQTFVRLVPWNNPTDPTCVTPLIIGYPNGPYFP
jgi:hypothetical protein